MGKIITLFLTLALEAAKAAGDIATAEKVEKILARRPKLKEAESKLYRRALERLGR